MSDLAACWNDETGAHQPAKWDDVLATIERILAARLAAGGAATTDEASAVRRAIRQVRAVLPSTSAEDWHTLEGREAHGFRRGVAAVADAIAAALDVPAPTEDVTDDGLRARVEALADDLWSVAPCGCGHRADLHTMGDPFNGVSVCTGGLGTCGCDWSFVRIAQERLRQALVNSEECDRMRGTGGNQFIEANATCTDLIRSINDQLGDLLEWATETGRALDIAEITISTKRIPNGRISVSVTADLAREEEAS